MDPRSESIVVMALLVIVAIAAGIFSSYTSVFQSIGIICVCGLMIGLFVTSLLGRIHVMGAMVDGTAAGFVAIVIAIIVKILIWLL